jgi:enoyl-CoA hydratase
MTQASKLQIQVIDGRMSVTIDRADKRNALSRAILNDIRVVFTEYAADKTIRMATLQGAGDKCFAAGGDLLDLQSVRTRDEATLMSEQGTEALNAIRNFPVPVVALLNGDALGGGAELAMACDFRLATAKARIGFLQGRLNISTAWGGGVDLFQALGRTRALYLLGSCEMIGGARAMELGLIHAMADEGKELNTLADEFLAPFMQRTPKVLRAFKGLANAVRQASPRAELDAVETRYLADTWIDDAHWQAMETLLNKGA